MQEGHEVLIVTSKDEEVRSEGPSFQFRFIELSRKGTNPFAELRSIFSFWRVLREYKPNLIHNFTVKCVIYGSVASLFIRHVKVVNSITGLGSAFIRENYLSAFIRFLYRLVFRLSKSSIIFQNEDDMEYFRKHNILPDTKIHLIKGSGVDLEKFSFQATDQTQEMKVFFASRLLRDKGIVELIHAAKTLQQKGHKFQVIIAGDVDSGNPSSLSSEEFKKLVAGLPVKWVGQVNDVLPLLRESQIVCLPSYREGTPMILLEAAACGKAMVTTDVPGCRNVVIDGKTGLLAKVRSADDLAIKLERLMKDADLRKSLGENARKYVEENFGRERILSEILKTYEL
jgi:glycosyltransferase involved in cell wall biosynthesis